MKNKKYASAATIAVAVASLAMAVPAFAETSPTTTAPVARQGEHRGGRGMGMGMMDKGEMGMRGAHGTVSAINGNTLTITETNPKDSTTKTYTVDATGAKVIKAGVVSTVSAIAVGDTVMANGPTNGTTITAKMIFDGKMGARPEGEQEKGQNEMSLLAGDGQPILGGTVTAVSGTTITITNKSNTTYTVNAATAKFTKKGETTATIANVATGDAVLVQGAINGNSITATAVMDQGVPPAAPTENTTATGTQTKKPGFMGRMHEFFSNLF